MHSLAMVVCFVSPPPHPAPSGPALVVLRYNPASLHVLFLRFHLASPSISKCKVITIFLLFLPIPFLSIMDFFVVVYYGFLLLLHVLHNPDVASTVI